MIRQVDSTTKILIVDSYTYDIIFSIFTRNELTNENICKIIIILPFIKTFE